jgi:hypothetical protein
MSKLPDHDIIDQFNDDEPVDNTHFCYDHQQHDDDHATDLVKFDLVKFDFIKFDFVKFDFVKFDFVKFDFVKFDFVKFDFVKFDLVKHDDERQPKPMHLDMVAACLANPESICLSPFRRHADVRCDHPAGLPMVRCALHDTIGCTSLHQYSLEPSRPFHRQSDSQRDREQ